MSLAGAQGSVLTEFAPAKINLTLRVLGRRPDGYHEIESLVAFADAGDRLELVPGEELSLTVAGPAAADAGPAGDNLVLKAARALAARVPDLALGRFRLAKELPVAAGLGGGSADAAAALRLLARFNRLAAGDPRLADAAAATGADVPVCLDPRGRTMRGIGERLSPPLTLPPLAAVLANPGVPVATRDVFAALNLPPGTRLADPCEEAGPDDPIRHSDDGFPFPLVPAKAGTQFTRGAASGSPLPRGRAESGSPEFHLMDIVLHTPNDLEPAAIGLQPAIADVLSALRALPGCRLARMSGSGATCFALFETRPAADAAAARLAQRRPAWWVRSTVLR